MPSSAFPPSQAPSGELLAGRYELERRIGQGGMAEVWVATDTDLDRKVAVKWLKSNLASDPVVAERFRREAIAVARLTHPNIVAIHDVFVHQGRQAVVMQLVDGKSLRQLLDSQRRLGPELTIHIGAAIVGALNEAHRSGFVHRDVKPGNILVTSDGRVLLTDFGIAKGLEVGDEDLTSDNVMMGTAKYLSPEQVRGRRLDGRADIYSLGLVLYECLAGRVPFLGQSDADTALARLQRDPTHLGHLRPTLPIGLVNLIHRTLARNPAHRPQSGAELRQALITVDTTPPQIDRTPADPPPSVTGAGRGATEAGPTTRRGRRTARAGSGVPGEPHVPASTSTDHDEATPPIAGPSDSTPVADGKVRGAPARRDEQRWTPSLVAVGGLLAVAAIAAFVLFVAANRGEPASDLQPIDSPVGDTATGHDPSAGEDADPVLDPADVRIVGIRAWDPYGDGGGENDGQAERALADGNATTGWATECYQDRYMGAKQGVGLIVELNGTALGTVTVDSLNPQWQIDVLTATGDTAPGDISGWQLVDKRFDRAPGTVEVALEQPARHVLIWLKELGRDDACSSRNPYRGRLGEISFRP